MLSILTLNIHQQQDRWLGRREIIVTELLERQPDVVALQQVNIPARQANWIMRQVNARLGERRYSLLKQGRRPFWRGRDGVAILSRLPVVSTEYLDLGYDGQVALLSTFELSSGYLVDVVSVHLAADPNLPDVRYDQLMRLMGWMQLRGRSSLQILAGGFNDVPNSRVIDRLKQRYRSAFELANGREPIATFPTALAYDGTAEARCLDYLFLSRGFDVQQAKLLGANVHPIDESLFISDHVGLAVDIQLRRTE